MPARSSRGWLGCRRVESRPARPSVSRAAVTTRIFDAIAIRSRLVHSLATAAAISAVMPRPVARIASPVVASSSSHSRNSPTVLAAHGGEGLAIERVVDNAGHFVAIVGDDRVLAEVVQREIGEHGLGRDSFLLGARRDAGEFVARARFVGAREQFLDRAESVRLAEQSRREFHPGLCGEMKNADAAD